MTPRNRWAWKVVERHASPLPNAPMNNASSKVSTFARTVTNVPVILADS